MQTSNSDQTVEIFFCEWKTLEFICCFHQLKFIVQFNSIQRTLLFQESKRPNSSSSTCVSNAYWRGKILQAAFEVEIKKPYLFLDIHPQSPEFAGVRENIFQHDLLIDSCWLYMPKDMEI